ncbi:hypothetical protein ACO0QE_004046 [Hanseniaspora vineae]
MFKPSTILQAAGFRFNRAGVEVWSTHVRRHKNVRLPTTTKDGRNSFYKGTRSSGIGRHTRFGRYVINWDRVRTFVTPEVPNLHLKPLVSHHVDEFKNKYDAELYPKGAQDGQLYFDSLIKYIKEGETPVSPDLQKTRVFNYSKDWMKPKGSE